MFVVEESLDFIGTLHVVVGPLVMDWVVDHLKELIRLFMNLN
jgi:hypothetical protein